MSLPPEIGIFTMLDSASVQVNRYLGIFIFFFGLIGNILNIFVLAQRTLRSNPCAWLFLMSSIASIIACISGLTTRILSSWKLDFTETNTSLCKLRAFITFSSITVTFWLITLATIDRWLSSSISHSLRQASTVRNARRGTIFIVCLSVVLYIHVLFCFEANLVDTPIECYNKSTKCRLLNDLSFAFVTILCPLLLMIFFGSMTIANVREVHRRIHHQPLHVNAQQRQHKKIDRQLLLMLLFQITLLLILSLPLPIERLYLTITNRNMKTISQKSIDNFIFNFALLLVHLANAVPFYIYTISGGNTFRKALFNVYERFRRIISCH